MATPKFLECNLCGNQQPYEPFVPAVCKKCESQWLEARYDYEAFKREILRGLPNRPSNMWRYQDILPLNNPSALDLYPAGGTPLWLSHRFAPALGHDSVYLKDERYGSTSSFKDRQAAGAVAAMLENGIKEAVIASTGNAAVAYAAACARAGIKLWVFMTSLVPQEKLREAALFGAEVIRVSGNYDQTKQIAAQFAQRKNLLLDRGATSVPAREAMKTIAYEIVEQLGWRTPDQVVIPMASGSLLTKIWKGLHEMRTVGLIDDVRTKINGAQAEGCSPISTAFKAGRDFFKPVKPKTIAKSLAIGNPADGYYALKATAESKGSMDMVSDEEVVEGIKLLAQTEGIFAETAGGVTIGVLQKLVKQGTIKKTDVTVAYITGNGLKTQEAVIDAVGRPHRIQPSLVSFEQTFKVGKYGSGDA